MLVLHFLGGCLKTNGVNGHGKKENFTMMQTDFQGDIQSLYRKNMWCWSYPQDTRMGIG